MRLKILGLDPSSTMTGYAVHSTPGEPAEMVVGSFSCREGADGDKKARMFCRDLKALIALYKPDFIAWERAKPNISSYAKKAATANLAPGDATGGWTVNAGQLILPEIQGCIRGMAKAYGIPSASAYPNVWRAAVIGHGAGGYDSAKAKQAAKDTCKRDGIRFHNEHEAEAALIALWAASCPEFRWYRNKRHNRPVEVVA